MEIKHSTERPPNWHKIIKAFPTITWDDGIIITYGDTYHSAQLLSDDFIVHEATHMRQQQAIGIEEWWAKYFADPVFRLHQEVEAYRNQLKFLQEKYANRDRGERRFYMRQHVAHFATILSSDIYGRMIIYNKAVELIKP